MRGGNLVVVVVVVVTTVVCVAGANEICPNTSSDRIPWRGVRGTFSFCVSFVAEMADKSLLGRDVAEVMYGEFDEARRREDDTSRFPGIRGGGSMIL